MSDIVKRLLRRLLPALSIGVAFGFALPMEWSYLPRAGIICMFLVGLNQFVRIESSAKKGNGDE